MKTFNKKKYQEILKTIDPDRRKKGSASDEERAEHIKEMMEWFAPHRKEVNRLKLGDW